jgi:hypothetical protein
MISPLERVVRSDGTRILVSEKIGTKQEFKLIKTTITSSLIVLSAFWAMWSFFVSNHRLSSNHEQHTNILQVFWHLEHLPWNLLLCSRSCLVLFDFTILLHVSIMELLDYASLY